jgi:queuine/archaeosine tRNA-ribosyltransferase
MCNITCLNKQQKEENIHNLFGLNKFIFVDCGIFQLGLYKKMSSWPQIQAYREKLCRWYSLLKPDVASSLDLPTSFDFQADIQKRLRWSIENYIFMQSRVDTPLYLGICAFSKSQLQLAKRLIQQRIGEPPPLLGLGGMVPLIRLSGDNPKLGRLILNVIFHMKRNFPRSFIHVYGLGAPKWYPLIRLLGVSSSDYASYIYISKRGLILLPGDYEGYILRKVKLQTKRGFIYFTRPKDKVFSPKQVKLLSECKCPVCKISFPEELEYNDEYRLVHNLSVILSQCKTVDNFCLNNDFKGLRSYIKENLGGKDNNMKNLVHYTFKLAKDFG